MENATIYFSDKSTIELNESDYLIPIVSNKLDDKITASMGESMQIWNHIHNGLIPSIMDVFVNCDFFYINHDYDTAYNSKAIVKIELS